MTRPLVRLENVDVALDGTTILRGVSWRLMPGESWAILGGNGSGKSTLLRLIRGELWPVPGCGQRVYALDGEKQTSAVGVKESMALVSPELQQRYLQQEWLLTGRQVIESGVGGGDYVYQGLTAAQMKSVERVAQLMGAEHLLGRNVQELSTGELRRVLIARALAGKPRVLVCDEICDGLDTSARAGLLAALDRVARNGTQLLITTHRSEELVPAITRRLVLERGRIVECGRLPRRTKPRAEAGQLHELRGIRREPDHTRDQIRLTLDARIQRKTASSPHLVSIRNASIFLGPRRVLRDVNWAMRTGEHWAVLGGNGAGKTTFLKLVLGDLHPALGGRVQRFEFTTRNTIWEVKRRIGWVSPELQAAYREDVTGAEVIGSGFFSSVGLRRKMSATQQRRVQTLARALGIEALAKKCALQTSFGEFRKLLLARALVHKPELLICDEPFDGLDAASRSSMAATLERAAANGASLLVVTHHADDLPVCMTHVARLAGGKIEFQGTRAEFAAWEGSRRQ
jgi:molybdate transport system ATP-binding protein